MKWPNFLFCCLIILLPAVTPAQQISSNYLSRKLDNGLQLLIIEDASIPLVSINFVVKEGPLYLSESEKGLNLLSSLMFIGATEHLPSAALSRTKLQNIHAEYSNELYESAQTYSFRFYKSYTDSVLSLLSDWVQHAIVTNEELVMAKYLADSVLKASSLQSEYLLNTRRNKLFEKYGLLALVSNKEPANIQACTREQFIEYRDKFYRPSNCMLIVQGKVNKFDIISKVNKLFGVWNLPELKSGERNMNVHLPLSTQSLIGSTTAQYPTLQFCFPGPSIKQNTVDYYAGQVLGTLLNNSNHPFKAGLSKYISYFEFETEQFNILSQAFFSFTCIIPPDQLKKSYDTLNLRLNMLSNYIRDDAQLADAKRRTYQLYEQTTSKTNDYMNLLAVYWANDLLNEYYSAQTIINKLTAADLQSYIARYIANKASARFLIISPAHQDATNSRTFFSDFESYDDLTIYFDRNMGNISSSSENAFFKVVQFLKINRQSGTELTIYQDTDERKDLVRKRYAELYSKLYEEGISESELDEMNVNLYIASTKSTLDKYKNQRAVFSKPKQ